MIAPISIVEAERNIIHLCGSTNIDMGIMAMVWGMAAVMLFTLLYRTFGFDGTVARWLTGADWLRDVDDFGDNDATRHCRYRIDGR
ncbi:hypothetical protein O9992_12690 [Vibrio lentus]|nr:hypothetical protein [Vibrio lentus]